MTRLMEFRFGVDEPEDSWQERWDKVVFQTYYGKGLEPLDLPIREVLDEETGEWVQTFVLTPVTGR